MRSRSVHGASARSGRLTAAWLIGTVLAVLALSHVPVGEAFTDTPTAAVSGAEALALPAAKRLLPDGAELVPSAVAVLPPLLALTLLAGLAADQLRPARSGPGPLPARGPPVALG